MGRICDLLKKRKDKQVMLCRFDGAEIDGLFSDAGYVELDAKTPEEASLLILERLAINEGKAKNHHLSVTWPQPLKSPIPNNLPRIQPFFGRGKEIEQIREVLDPESRTWGALIDGPGGMGKTTLAVRAAYDCTPEQFKRIIFLSVKDCEMDDDGERKLTGFILPGSLEILNELARELGQPDIPKSPEDQRIRLLLEALRPAQALLILDNLESLPKSDRDQLFTFVKRLPQGCKAILTSRRLIGSGSELLILEPLPILPGTTSFWPRPTKASASSFTKRPAANRSFCVGLPANSVAAVAEPSPMPSTSCPPAHPTTIHLNSSSAT
jgi:hypothetical protein